MSTVTHVILQEKDEEIEKKLDWSYIEWAENENEVEPESESAGVCSVQTQTDSELGVPDRADRETQTSSPIIMHIDLTRKHSRLRHLSLADGDALVTPYFQFDRQAPGRISTSPTLRRMRSTRRPQSESMDAAAAAATMGTTQEEPSSGTSAGSFSSSVSSPPLSPVPRVVSPLALSPLPDGRRSPVLQHISSSGKQRTKSHRSRTFDHGQTSPPRTERHSERHSERLSLSQGFVFPERSESQEELSHNR
ncbi:hypothetical protein NL108_016550 [Boleophthalmus pectinirostris]|nr:hypothetical protein NL108_016550 [Boleophthalmus pectinirostris]